MNKSVVLGMAMALGVTASAYAANPFSDVPETAGLMTLSINWRQKVLLTVILMELRRRSFDDPL